MKRAVFALVTVLVLLAACRAPSPTPSPAPAPAPPPAAVATPAPAVTPTPSPAPRVVADQMGRRVTLPARVERIISLAPSNTEILYALGLGDKVVGVSTVDDYPPQVKEKAVIATYPALDIERVVALAPDLVLVSGINKPVITKLEERRLTVLGLDPQDLPGVIAAIRLAGEVTGAGEAARELAARLEARIGAVRTRVAGLSEAEKPRVLYLIWHDPIWTGGKGTFIHDLITLAGGKNLFADQEGWVAVGLEVIVARNPQVLITSPIIPSEPGQREDLLFRWAYEESRLRDTEARRAGRIELMDAALVQRPGPRIVNGLELVAQVLHPRLFR